MSRWTIPTVLGVVAAIALTGFALVREAGRIEAELAGEAAKALEGETTYWARVTANGRDLSITGDATGEDVRDLAADRVNRIFGVRSVDMSGTGLIAEAKPYTLSLKRDGARMVISGNAPSVPDKARLVSAFVASVPNLAYDDDLVTARGMPDAGFLEAATGLMPLLGQLSAGEIKITDRAVSITGAASSNDAYGRLNAGKAALPVGYTLAEVNVTRPVASPYVFSAKLDDATLSLAGFAPEPAVRANLFGVARSLADQKRTIDAVDLAAGAPTEFEAAATAALGFLEHFATAEIEISDGRIRIAGVALTPETYRFLIPELAAFKPAGFEVESAVDLPIVRPFTLSATRADGQMVVAGFAPDDAAIAGIRAAADAVPGSARAVVETIPAAGAPEGFADAARFAIGLLGLVDAGSVVIADRTISLSGIADSGAALLDIDAMVATSTPDGYRVDARVTPPIASPYVWSIERREDALEITGFAPDEATRAAIRDSIENASGDLAVADRSSLAGGLSPRISLAGVAAFAAEVVMKLDSGTARLEDGVLSIAGRTADALEGRSITEFLAGDLPAGIQLGRVAIDAPSLFQFSVERDRDRISVTGAVASEKSAADIEALLQRLVGKAEISVNVSPVAGLPADADAAISLAVRAISLLATGSATINGGSILVKGKAFTEAGAVRISSALSSSVPAGYELDVSAGIDRSQAPLDADACQALFDALTARNTILFASGKAAIDADSAGLLDELAAAALRCKETNILVEGHTDDDGEAAANLALSEERAKAVVTFLANAGIDAKRLRAEGFGAERPVADNSTPEGKARNRRIEFKVEAPLPPP